MVIPSPHVGVAPNAFALAADDQHRLRMRLKSGHAIDNIHPGLAHHTRPLDIRRLVETRLQLDDGRHLLPIPCRCDQCLHNRRVGTGAVERLLDRQHLGILRRLGQKIDHRLEAVIRMVQQDVALPNMEK